MQVSSKYCFEKGIPRVVLKCVATDDKSDLHLDNCTANHRKDIRLVCILRLQGLVPLRRVVFQPSSRWSILSGALWVYAL